MPKNNGGYVFIREPGHPMANSRGNVLEHRKVWFDIHGQIPSGHVIHHINGDKADNRIENLQLMTQSQHMKEHYPSGFCSEAWNKGKTEYSKIKCKVCGKEFTRQTKEIKKTQVKGRGVVCSKQCTGRKKGKSVGWTLHKSGRYQAQCKRKYLGLFKTQAEAEKAYEEYARSAK